jgi:hypothetical protein
MRKRSRQKKRFAGLPANIKAMRPHIYKAKEPKQNGQLK